MSRRGSVVIHAKGTPQGGTANRRWVLRARDARIRSKLGLLLVIPIIAVVSLAAASLVQGGRRAADADMVAALSTLSADVSELSHALHGERMAAAEFIISPRNGPTAYNRQSQRTDRAVAAYTARRGRLISVPTAARRQLERIDGQLPTITSIRQQVLGRQDRSPTEIVLRYGLIINELVAYREQLDRITSDNQLATALRAVAAFSKAKAQAAEEQALGYVVLTMGVPDAGQYSSFLATLTAQQEAFLQFSLTAHPQQRAIVDNVITGDALELADRAAQEVRGASGHRPQVSATDLSLAVGAVIDLMRVAERRLDQNVIQDAQVLRTAVVRQVVIESSVVLLALVLAVAIAVLLARSMVRSLARLRDGAMTVANTELPDAVARLRDAPNISEHTVEEVVAGLRDPIQLDGRDEMGQVAQAFNVVHRSAVRIAAEQAALRSSVSIMFLNLARRSQTLVDRMIGELDQIERGEDDPKRLSRLFQLDHLATRMRRNDENLLVLAGADSSPPRMEHAALIDVIRAAQSEIELYERVEFSVVDQEVWIAANAVNDIARLLAELLDNATRFSAPETIVVVDAARMGDHVLVQIEDRGLGMTDDQLGAVNARLSTPAVRQLADIRMMGLAVVHQLAVRYQIKVMLRPNPGGGTIADVRLPAGVLVVTSRQGPGDYDPWNRPPALVASAPGPALLAGPSPAGYGAPAPGLPARPGGPAMTALPRQYWPGGRPDRPPGQQVNGNAAARIDNAGPVAPVATAQPVAVPLAVTAPAATPTFAPVPVPVPADGRAGPSRSAGEADTTEMPIFREVQAVWFSSHGHSALDEWPLAQAGSQTATSPGMPYTGASPAAPAGTAVAAPGSGIGQATGAATREGTPLPPEAWRTAADEGWRAAAAAADPRSAGTTRSGLAKRVPSANLVPGGVPTPRRGRGRRSPEEVRGMLSAYHRGVQRGRAGGVDAAGASDPVSPAGPTGRGGPTTASPANEEGDR